MSSLYADLAGPGSVVAAQDGGRGLRASRSRHARSRSSRPTTRTSPTSARRSRASGTTPTSVDVIVDVPNSGVALAVNQVTQGQEQGVPRRRAPASSDLTGKACSPNTVHWTYDTWMLANGTGSAIVEDGRQHLVLPHRRLRLRPRARARHRRRSCKATAARCSARCAHPLNDAGLLLVPAAGAGLEGARSSASPTPAATPSTRSSRPPSSASSRAARSSPACWCSSPTCTRSGLKTAQGLILTETFYWDLNDQTRAFAKRFAARRQAASMPTMVQAGVYSAVLHYLKAVEALKTDDGTKVRRQDEGDADRRSAVRQGHDPRRRPQDPPTVPGRGEEAGRVEGPWDYYKLRATIPADQAFRPLDRGRLPAGEVTRRRSGPRRSRRSRRRRR